MPRLDARLRVVAQQIRAPIHIDIGSDHANLLVALLKSGRIERGIAVENKRQPYENSCAALAGLNAEVRFADGLRGIHHGEADSLSICGVGGENMVAILEGDPDGIPPLVVLQPNRRPELLREWALANRFHLVDEQIAWGHWPYVILTYRRSESGPDPAFRREDHQADLILGPFNLQRRDPKFIQQLVDESDYLRGLDRLNVSSRNRLEVIERVLRRWQVEIR